MSSIILYADADAGQRTAVSEELEATRRLSPVTAASLRAARERLAAQRVDAVVVGATVADGAAADLVTTVGFVAPWLPLFVYAADGDAADTTAHETLLTDRYDAEEVSPAALADELAAAIEERSPTPNAERETDRLTAVDGYDIPTAASLPFDRLTGLAADVLDAPVSFVSVITDREQQLLGASGLDVGCIDRANSVCTHGLHEESHLAVTDLLADPRFASIGELRELGLRSYLGVPLRAPGGESLGMFCVMDTEAREYDECDVARLRGFARTAMDMLSLQRPDPLDSPFGA
ncbi:GAF domain-containing protein [Halosegnis longus]|uniref:GAF domain-containing protein n=1 Tax=Halosegnis longus TaxID=2216012 RepID=UPI001561F96B|nr:GAF domain-containing protein [Halosegnis longus]